MFVSLSITVALHFPCRWLQVQIRSAQADLIWDCQTALSWSEPNGKQRPSSLSDHSLVQRYVQHGLIVSCLQGWMKVVIMFNIVYVTVMTKLNNR